MNIKHPYTGPEPEYEQHHKGLCDFFQEVAVRLKPALKRNSKGQFVKAAKAA